jgi:hypothetical protein
MKLVHYLSLIFLLLVTLTSPNLLASVPVSIDTDGDGLPDDWETANGRNPLVADYTMSTGGGYSCAIDDTGVTCWGRPSNGDLGQMKVSPS